MNVNRNVTCQRKRELTTEGKHVHPCLSVSLLAVGATLGPQFLQGPDVPYNAFIEAFFLQEIWRTLLPAGFNGFHEPFSIKGCSTGISLDRIESGIAKMV